MSEQPLPSAPHRDYSRLADTAFAIERVSAVRAMVVGAGALGNEVIKNLALLGIGQITIVDRDIVELSNLTRSILFARADIHEHIAGRTPKAELAAARTTEINPDVAVRAMYDEVADVGFGWFRRCDVVFSCLDNEIARLELSWACSRLNLPLIDGGLGRVNASSGMVSLFPGRNGPCYACRKSPSQRLELLVTLHGQEDPCWAKPGSRPDDTIVATTPLMASATAALQTEIGLRAVLDRSEDVAGKAYIVTLHPRPGLDAIQFGRSYACTLHEPNMAIDDVIERNDCLSSHTSVRDLLTAYRARSLTLDWPLVVDARCDGCGAHSSPFVRVARLRASRCAACGTAAMAPFTTVTQIDNGSPLADRTIAALGLPAAHIHMLDTGAEPMYVELTGDLAQA